MTKVLRIAAKREGYRRCGVGHSEAAVDHAIDSFDEKQIEILKADPMLVVAEMDSAEAAEAKAGAEAEIDGLLKATQADQKAAAEARGEAEADRKKAAGELSAAEKERKAAEADRKKAADELAAATKAREAAEAAPKGEKPPAKGGKKAG